MVTASPGAPADRAARRYVVYGAGAIGGTIAARLHGAGHDVTVIARGEHLNAMAAGGLEYTDPGGTRRIPLHAVSHPRQLRWRRGDVVVLAVKTQDTGAALAELVPAAAPGTPVVCAQNGIENERLCARFFENVYGLYVLVSAAHLEAGAVTAYQCPGQAVLDVGRYPSGVDECATALARDLSAAGFSSRPVAYVMRWKSAKLLANLANSIEAAWGSRICEGSLYRLARREGEDCLTRAGIGFVSPAAVRRRRRGLMNTMTVRGRPIPGGSTWQTVARGHATTEADFLNGEIVLLGRLHGVPTPVNGALQRIVREMAADGTRPGTVPVTLYQDMCRAHRPQAAVPARR